MNSSFFGSIRTWLGHPFNADGTALQWAGFLGLVIIASIFWFKIIREIELNS